MNNYNKISLLIVATLFIIGLPISAQEVTDDEEITVVAPYQPKVEDAFKINVTPRIPDEKLEKPQFNYTAIGKELKTAPDLEPITAARIQGESVTKLYKNYVRAGFGNYATPYLEFYANKLRSKKNAFGVHLKHISSAGKIKDYAYPGNSHTYVSGYGSKYWKKHSLNTELYYDRQGVHFYGFKPNEFPEFEYENKDIAQNYNLIGLNSSFGSNYTSYDKLNHTLSFDYYYLFDKPGAQEHNFNFNANLNKNFSFFDFSEYEKLGLDLGLDYYHFGDKILPTNNSGIIEIKPYYNMGFDQYNFRLGIKTQVELDTNTSVHVYPTVHLEVKVVEDYLITFAGINGNLQKNSLKSMSDENLFIAQNIHKRFTNEKFSQYGGVKGRITDYLDYNLSFMNSSIDNMLFFVNDTMSAIAPGLNNQFKAVYDNIRYSRIIAEFGFHYLDKLNVNLRGKYNNYFMGDEEEAWHRPKLEISLLTDYNIQDKILVKAELLTRSKMYARVYQQQIENSVTAMVESVAEIDAMIDLNLGLEYRYTKVLSGFVNFNNILGQRYYHWYNYPSYRFNMMLGVTYSF